MGLLAVLGLLPPPSMAGRAAPAAALPAVAGPGPALAAGDSPVTLSLGQLKALSQWPADAHRAWKRLTTLDRVGIFDHMTKRYGQPFAQAFVDIADKGGARFDTTHFVTALAHQTPQWFNSQGYRLAKRSSYQEWWVHAGGPVIYLVLQSSPKALKDALDKLLKAAQKAQAEFGAIVIDLEMRLGPNPFGPPSAALFDEYVRRLAALDSFVDAALVAAEGARAALKKQGIGVAEFDDMRAPLADIQQRVTKKLEPDHLDELDPSVDHSDGPPPDPNDTPAPIDFSGKGP